VFFSGVRLRAHTAILVIVLVGLVVLAPSCSRKTPPGPQRLAILRFENLTGDESLDWMGRAASEVISAELTGSTATSIISSGTLHATDRILRATPHGTRNLRRTNSRAGVRRYPHSVRPNLTLRRQPAAGCGAV
jgi:hypothetical protein